MGKEKACLMCRAFARSGAAARIASRNGAEAVGPAFEKAGGDKKRPAQKAHHGTQVGKHEEIHVDHPVSTTRQLLAPGAYPDSPIRTFFTYCQA